MMNEKKKLETFLYYDMIDTVGQILILTSTNAKFFVFNLKPFCKHTVISLQPVKLYKVFES